MKQEIEVKIQVPNEQLKQIEEWLNERGVFCGQVQHCEYYLDNPSCPLTFISPEGFKDARYYLRVRQNLQKGDSICLKKWHSDSTGKTTHCDEWEISVSDGKIALELLNALGFSGVTPIKKVRRIYQVESFEIVIDNVENLGIFIEFELKEQVKDVQQGLQQIYAVIRRMGITKFKKQERGYVSMVWNPKYDFGQKMLL